MRKLPLRAALGCAVVALLMTGCGGPKVVKVHGKLLKNGSPMIVSESTYVTLSFIPEAKEGEKHEAKSYSAKFDQKTGTYTVELPAGSYRVMQVVALPGGKDGKLNAPKPTKSDKVYDLTSDQELDLVAPAN